MHLSISFFLRLFFLLLILFGLEAVSVFLAGQKGEAHFVEQVADHKPTTDMEKVKDSIEIRVGTFLGNSSRNYYGDSMGNDLQVIWKSYLGKGTTIVSAAKGVEEWFGAGWTGQPLVVKENERTFLIQGAFDHHLKKIDAATGEVIWNYEYDDILKGTGTIWVNDSAKDPLNRIVILQGSRKGVQNSMASPVCASYRAVSFFTGKELWRYNVKQTDSYSRDVDASALILSDTAYLGLENGKFISFDPGRTTIKDDSINHPVVYSEHPLYNAADHAHHGGNLVTEGSPAKIGNHIYVASGSGHVFGYNLQTKIIDWDFYIGSDMDGTPVVTSDSCLLVEVEKQYITGKGGIFKLNPRKDPAACVDWYFPTGDIRFSSWDGGVIGSVSVNDAYNNGADAHLAAFTGIDGNLNVVEYDKIRNDSMVAGPDGKTKYHVPVLHFRHHIGPSISTPVFSQRKLIAAGYNGINLFSYDADGKFTLLKTVAGNFEASPVTDQGRVYIASRDGFLYCFGDTSKQIPLATTPVVKKENPPAVIKKEAPVIVKETPKPVVTQTPKPVIKKPVVHVVVANKIFSDRLLYAIARNSIEHPKQVTDIAVVEKPVVNEPVISPINSVPGSYHLIAGVFRSKENATNFEKLWKNRGMKAEIIVFPNGMYYVSIADGNTENDLAPLRTSVRAKYNADSWVFTREE
ncbi:MAG: PQQ-binding-like beta-propeller repeat protein [Bacteroidota bacterium]|nr:PQQ-binding-like beta-propeller repeat protein [Bacteroidota bacterium]